jgi:hypothetical protein
MNFIQRYAGMAMRAIQQALTGRDNLTVDVARVGIAGALLALIGYTGFDVLAMHHAFSASDFGIGSATILGGGGAAVALKRQDEPGA